MTESSSTHVLAPEVERKELIELAQFVLTRKTRDIRNELTKYLIARVISKHAKQREGIVESDILPLIEVEYGLPRFPDFFVHSALESMIEDGSLAAGESPRGRTYMLNEMEQKQIEAMAKAYEEIRSSATSELVERVKSDYGQLSEQDAELLTAVFFGLLGSLLAEHGINCAQAITYGRGGPAGVLEYRDFTAECEVLFSKIADRRLRESLSKALRGMFLNPSKNFLAFLHCMAQGYVILQILNLDPNCIQLEKASLAKRKIYLDTNVIIALTCSGHELHQAVVDLIELTRSLGVHLVFSARTKTEFLRRFEESTSLYHRISGISKDVTRKAMEIMPDPFIRTFRMEGTAGVRLGWEWFAAKMQGVELVLKDKFDVEFDQEKKENVDKDVNLEPLTTSVFRAAYPDKSERVARHDGFHIVLIDYLRKGETTDELGTNYWFLTLDHTLERAERAFARETEREQWLPSSIDASTWLDMISTFLSPDIAREEPAGIFARLLASELPALTRPIDSYDIADLTGGWMEDPGLRTDTLRKIVGNEFVRKTLASFREADARGEPANLGQVLTPILAAVKKEMEEKYTPQIEEVSKELEKLRSLDLRFARTRRPLLVFGSLSLALLATFSLLEAFLKWHFPDIVYTSFLILTVVLVGSAAFGRSILERYLT